MSGIFNSFKQSLSQAADSVSRDVDKAAREVSNKWDEHKQSPLLDTFRTGNVIQLMSASTGRSLQIVRSPDGHLTVDGVGAEGPSAANACWTVFNEGRNIVRLDNYRNFLAIENGVLVVKSYPENIAIGLETRFRLHQVNDTHVCLESATPAEAGRHVGILPNGQIKSPVSTGREQHAQFGVRIISAVPVVPPSGASVTVKQ